MKKDSGKLSQRLMITNKQKKKGVVMVVVVGIEVCNISLHHLVRATEVLIPKMQ